MGDPITSNTIGRLAQSIRSIFTKLDPLETKVEIHGEKIDRLEKNTEALSRDLADTKEALDGSVREVSSLKSILHGEKIKRGKAVARAARAETALNKKRR